MGVSTFNFTGLENTMMQGSYTLAHGISPGIATIEVPAGTNVNQIEGDLTIKSDQDTLTFKGFRIDNIGARQQKGTVWNLKLIDRRWKWKFGEISGHYNLRNERGKIEEETEKTPQELAKLCLEEMQESNFDVANLPNDPRPQIDWSFKNPAAALASLCDELGCRVVLQIDGRVEIHRLGVGADLPGIQGVGLSQSATFDPVDGPASFLFVGGKTRYEDVFDLEAICQDEDKKNKLLDDIDFRPAGGWENERPGYFSSLYDDELDNPENKESNEKETPYDLAHKCIYKWYRIKGPISIFNDLMKKIEIGEDELDLILPIDDKLVETLEEVDSVTRKRKPKPALVWGEYYDKSIPFTNRKKGLRGLWRLDKNSGIVMFNRPIYKILDLEDGAIFIPAELQLKTSFSARDPETREWVRYTLKRNVDSGTQTGSEIVRNEEVVQTFNIKGETNNEDDKVVEKADYYIDAAVSKYEVGESGSRDYSGIRKFKMDGAISQITWSVARTGPTTRISRNNEHDIFIAPYGQRRRDEMIDELLKETESAKRREANQSE